MHMKPCDCHDQVTANKLQFQGVGYNDNSIELRPSTVVLKIDNTTIRINQRLFEKFARWYLEDQEEEKDDRFKCTFPEIIVDVDGKKIKSIDYGWDGHTFVAVDKETNVEYRFNNAWISGKSA